MSTTNHNAVLASSEFRKYHDQLRAWIAALPNAEWSRFVEARGTVNGVVTFILAPDGSYEEKGESHDGDDLRERFVGWLREHSHDPDVEEDEVDFVHRGDWKWVEVGWGEYGQTVLQGNNVNCFGDEPYAVAGDAA